jgi:hypothetical protein
MSDIGGVRVRVMSREERRAAVSDIGGVHVRAKSKARAGRWCQTPGAVERGRCQTRWCLTSAAYA